MSFSFGLLLKCSGLGEFDILPFSFFAEKRDRYIMMITCSLGIFFLLKSVALFLNSGFVKTLEFY